MNKIEEFNAYRSKMNEKIMATDNKALKRLYNLDTNTYTDGAVDIKSKEMIGLACSLVLRCDDCVKYHLEKCKELGLDNQQIVEVMSVACTIGGTIVIPHLRRAIEYLEEFDKIS